MTTGAIYWYMARTTSISLGSHFEEFVTAQVKHGRYGTVSEVVRAGLRALEQQQTRLDALRAAIDEGDASGFVEDFSIDDVLAEVKKGR